MLLPGNSLPPSAPVKSRKRDTGKQIQHRGKICEGLLTPGYISVAFSFRNLNHSLSSPNHYHSDVDVSRHTMPPNSDFSMITSGIPLCFAICYSIVCLCKEMVYMVHDTDNDYLNGAILPDGNSQKKRMT